MNTKFGSRLRAFRKQTGKTQADFAEQIGNGIKQAHVSAWEAGSFPDGENLELIYKAFPSLNRDWLVNGAGEMTTTDDTPTPSNDDTDIEALREEVVRLREQNYILVNKLLGK